MVNPSTRLRMNVILCGFGLAAPGVFRYLLGQVDNLAVFTHDDLAHAPGLTRQAQTAGVWHTTDSINTTRLPFEPDMVISIYYRHIIKRHIIEACRGRIFNAHPSLLPRHRGCSSIPWAMIEGDRETGITFHYIDEGVDTGPIIIQERTAILASDTQAALQHRLAWMVVDHFPLAFKLVTGGFIGCAQPVLRSAPLRVSSTEGIGQPSYHPRQCPYDGQIDSDWPVGKIERFIRAMIYPPLPPAKLGDQEVRSMDDYYKALGERYRESLLAR